MLHNSDELEHGIFKLRTARCIEVHARKIWIEDQKLDCLLTNHRCRMLLAYGVPYLTKLLEARSGATVTLASGSFLHSLAVVDLSLTPTSLLGLCAKGSLASGYMLEIPGLCQGRRQCFWNLRPSGR